MVKITQKLGRVINQVYDSNTLAMHIKALHPSLVPLKHFRKWVLCSNTRWQLLPFNKWCAVCIIRTLTLVWSKDPEFSWSANAFSQHTKKESDWKRPEKFQTELSKREQLSFKNTFYRFSLAKHCSSTNWRWCDGRYDDFVRSAVWACRCWFARLNHTEVMQRNNVRLLFSLIWLDRVLKSTLVSSLWRRFLTNFIKLGDDESLRSCFVLTRAQNKWILLHSWSVKSFSFPFLTAMPKPS